MQPTSIRIPAQLTQALDDMAARTTRSRSQAAVHLIRLGLRSIGRPDPLGTTPDDDDPGAAAASPERTPVSAPNRQEAA